MAIEAVVDDAKYIVNILPLCECLEFGEIVV
jgi:hypothetical protein